MIFKIVVTIGVIIMVYLLFFRTKSVDEKPTNTRKKDKKRDKEIEEVMVECESCDTFISTKDSIIKDGKFYCSKECAGLK